MAPGLRVRVMSPTLCCAVIAACGDGSAQRSMIDVPSSGSVAPSDPLAPDGSAPTSPAQECAEGFSMNDADAQQLFDYAHVPTFDFFLPEDDWASLQQNARDEQYALARACFDGQLIGDVGLRFKGYYGSLYGCFDENDELICPRLSMKVKFSEYDEEQRFFGLKRLNFNAYRHDDSRMKERLSYDLFRAMGIVTPRAAWAVLRVNGQSYGLYGMVEQIDGRFTADRWPGTPDGNLYKEVWPSDADESSLLAALKTNEESMDVSGYEGFAVTLREAAEEERLQVLDQYMDLDYLARYLAVDDAVANYDGITYFWTDGASHTNHNFYIFEQAPDSFVLIPWDVEATFWINPDHAAPPWSVLPEDCSETYPYWDGLALAPGCDPVFKALDTDLDRWREAARQLLDGPFALDAMRAAIDRHAAFIMNEALADPTPPMYASFDAAVAELQRVVPRLRERLEMLVGDD